MIVWVKSLLYDPQSFANLVRALVFGLGEVASQFGPSDDFYWAGHLIQVLALAIRAGDKNPTPTP